MKKPLFIALFAAFVFTSCKNSKDVEIISKVSETRYTVNCVDIDDSVNLNAKLDGEKGITMISGKKVTARYPLNIDLSYFANNEVDITFSADVRIDSANPS